MQQNTALIPFTPECFTLTCSDVNKLAEWSLKQDQGVPKFGNPPRKISYVRIAGMVVQLRHGKDQQGALAYIDDGTGVVQCMVLFDQKRTTAAQRLAVLRCSSGQLAQGSWVECRGKIAKRQVSAPLYEQFCLRVHSLHVHQDPFAELHHWHLLQVSRDILFPNSSPVAVTQPPVSLPVRVCQLLQAHVALTFEQLSAHLSISVPLLRTTITEVSEYYYIRQVSRTNQGR